ncbi:unnamed protein product [Sphenostylis stenocarpa]|uniref:Uncharacterized protein n=1 Tax=Sphenostylis stenocarpa TaxID=92480 RepID=A0AA86VW23_9FABA|nr:unnamed protein product [Sphenostylis stenocarpa]
MSPGGKRRKRDVLMWLAELWRFLVRSDKPSPLVHDMMNMYDTHIVQENDCMALREGSLAQVEYVAEPTPSNFAVQFTNLSPPLIMVMKA